MISDLQVRTFAQDGVLHLKGVLTKKDLNKLEKAILSLMADVGNTQTGYDLEYLGDRAYADTTDHDVGNANQYDLDAFAGLIQYSGCERLTDELPEDTPAGKYLIDTGCWLRNRSIRDLALFSELPQLSGTLMDAHSVRYYDDQMFVKLPGTKQRTAFHQDFPFFHLEGQKGCVMWIPVDRADADNGCLSYVRGSHLWDKQYKASMFISQTAMPGAQGEEVPDIDRNPDNYDLVSFTVEPGDIVIHDFRTLHGAGGNKTSDRPRRAMSLRYVGEDMRFKLKPGAPFQPYHNYEFVDGDPLCDENFPVVWQREHTLSERPALSFKCNSSDLI